MKRPAFFLFALLATCAGRPAGTCFAQALAIPNDVYRPEGNTGTSPSVFNVTLAPAAAAEVTVQYATGGGLATPGVDYLPVSGVLTFAPGETLKTITVEVVGDTLLENSEHFFVSLSSPVNATIADGQGIGGITDDDVALGINDREAMEGNAGTTDLVFTVTLSMAYSLTVTVDYATSGGIATPGVDYLPVSGTLTFAPGDRTKTITVQVIGDVVLEANEYFLVNLSNPVNAAISDGQGGGSIYDDDVSLSINDRGAMEGNAGTTDLVFTVTLSLAYSLTVTVDYAASGGNATPGVDYLPVSGTLIFAPGETLKTITVQVIGDIVLEANEYFLVNLSNPVNAAISDGQGGGSIYDDDVSLRISDQEAMEGNAGTTNQVFTVTLSLAYSLTVTVDYATSGGNATPGVDYLPVSGTLIFAPGETLKTITVQVIGDIVLEANEYFLVNLSNPANAAISDGQGAGSIYDDDVSLSIGDRPLSEGNAGTTAFTFNVTLSLSYSLTVTVDYATGGGVATPGEDYLPASGTLTFAPGDTLETVTVQVIGDAVLEASEYFYVNLSNPVNATIADGQGAGTIQNDDTPPAVSIADLSRSEGNNGTTAFDFVVTLSSPWTGSVSVGYATADGSASAASDYSAAAGTLTFLPGETVRTAGVEVQGDLVHENDEFFTVSLSNAVGATIGDGTAVGLVLDDDPLEVAIGDADMVEGDAGTAAFELTVSLSTPSQTAASVSWASAGISASSGIDFLPGAGTLTFAPGQTVLPLQVHLVSDADHEIDESFRVDLFSPVGLAIADAQGLGTILDDDAACSPMPSPVTDLRLAMINGGADLMFNWTDTPGSDYYELFESATALEPSSGPVGTAVSGSAGIVIPLPAGARFYHLASIGAACGAGPRRLCAHAPCTVGARLDSACDPCAAAVCDLDPSCCAAQWSAACVAAAESVCVLTCD